LHLRRKGKEKEKDKESKKEWDSCSVSMIGWGREGKEEERTNSISSWFARKRKSLP
jgi:hypothetical protein